MSNPNELVAGGWGGGWARGKFRGGSRCPNVVVVRTCRRVEKEGARVTRCLVTALLAREGQRAINQLPTGPRCRVSCVSLDRVAIWAGRDFTRCWVGGFTRVVEATHAAKVEARRGKRFSADRSGLQVRRVCAGTYTSSTSADWNVHAALADLCATRKSSSCHGRHGIIKTLFAHGLRPLRQRLGVASAQRARVPAPQRGKSLLASAGALATLGRSRAACRS